MCFIVYIKTDDIYKYIAEDVETTFDTSNYELDRPLPKTYQKVIGLMKDESGGKIMTKCLGLRAKTYSYLIDDKSKKKDTKECVIKMKLKFENYENCLEATQLENKINYLEKSSNDTDSFFCYKRKHKEFIRSNKLILKHSKDLKVKAVMFFTEEINKIALGSNDDKRMQ